MVEAVQTALGLVLLVGLGWGVVIVTRLALSSIQGPRGGRVVDASFPSVEPQNRPPSVKGALACCPECTPGCQVTGLAMGQAWGRGDDWWGQPFGDDGANVEAMVFWGDDCCVDCATCPICQGL